MRFAAKEAFSLEFGIITPCDDFIPLHAENFLQNLHYQWKKS